MTGLNLDDDEAEFLVFASALKEIFRGEPWAVVEPHAERAWILAGLTRTWEDVVGRLSASWGTETDNEPP